VAGQVAVPIGAGGGGQGRPNNDTQNGENGFFPGGGGGGTSDNNTPTGGVGGTGLVIVSYVRPTITSATLDYGTGILVVTVSEAVNSSTAVTATAFHINNTAGTNVVNLTNGELTSTGSATTITFTLSPSNLSAALAISGVGGGDGGAVVLDVDPGGIANANGNANADDEGNPVTETAPLVEPTTQATNITFSNITNNSMTVSWTNGNGGNRLVLAHAAGAVDADPADLTAYTANAAFGSGSQIGTGNRVVFSGSGNSVNVTNLSASTVYHFRVYEYNGTGATSDYNINTATGNPASRTTVAAAPTVQPTGPLTFTNITTTTMTVNYPTQGNGAGRVLVASAGDAVTGVPVNGTAYTPDGNYGTPAGGTSLGSGDVVLGTVTSTAAGSFNISGLTAGTTYHFALYEFNGSSTTISYFLTAPLTGNQITAPAEPGTQATNITFSTFTTTSMTVSWTGGNGANHLVLAHASAPVDANPADFTSYSANAAFTSGDQIGTGNYVVFSGAGTSVNVTGLTAATTYHFQVYTYDGTGVLSNFNVNTATGNPASQSMIAAAPTTQPQTMTFSAITNNSMTVNYATQGDGSARVLVASAGDAVSQIPVNGITYTPDGNYGTPAGGTNLTNGDIVVGVITSTAAGSFPVTGLTSGTTYHFALFEFNGTGTNTI
jgi:hypothetical protein